MSSVRVVVRIGERTIDLELDVVDVRTGGSPEPDPRPYLKALDEAVADVRRILPAPPAEHPAL